MSDPERPPEAKAKRWFGSYRVSPENLSGGCFVLVCGALFLAVGLGFAWDGLKTISWSSVEGTVTATRIGSMWDPKSDKVAYRPIITYVYTLDGVEYTCSELAGVRELDTESWAQSKIDEYPVGSEVIVHYDLERPSMAVLETGTGWWVVLPIAVGLGVIAGGCVLLKGSFRKPD